MHDWFQEQQERGVYRDLSIRVKVNTYVHVLKAPLANRPSFTHCGRKGVYVSPLQCGSRDYVASLSAEAYGREYVDQHGTMRARGMTIPWVVSGDIMKTL